MRVAETNALRMAYVEAGAADGWPVILSHGFPYDVHAYEAVAPILAAAGARVFVPYLRGFGPTQMRHDGQMRSGQQAALGKDLIDLMNALDVDRAILAGYDWGGLSSCVAAALWPERVAGLVSLAGYDVIDVERMRRPFPPSLEAVMWYQHLFQTERGREALTTDRRALCELLWRQWSPRWNFDAATFQRTAPSFDNPDFVDIVIHAYRFDFGLAAGDPELEPLERRLRARPRITVPAVTLDGADDPLKPGGTADHAPMFAGPHEHRTILCGHNLPQEAPAAFADAVLTVRKMAGAQVQGPPFTLPANP